MHRSGRLGAPLDDHPVGRAPSPRRHVDPVHIARRLGEVVRWAGAASVRERSWRLVAQTPDFDAWLIAWPYGATADLHDHGGSRGALHVIGGSLIETVPRRDEHGAVALAHREVRARTTLGFGAGHVHDVRNVSPAPALSLHVYNPPLTSMIYYDRFGDRLIPREGSGLVSDELGRSADRSRTLVAP